MNIKMRHVNSITVLDLDGKITLGESTAALRNAVRSLLKDGKKNILLNLGDVSFIDSAGVGELVSSYSSASSQGGRLKLLQLTKKVREVLSITKLLTVFETFDDETKAIASFK
ncbi:MAG: STAS domain-containing protein [Acidobacteria bacterium]|nr:STAS domain-containing protein [Acidobacteriota bacterium]